VLERKVKAAYLYRFANYVEWPSGTFSAPDSPIVIGIVGDDGLAKELRKSVEGKTVNGRHLSVRPVRGGESLAGLHILFIGGMAPNSPADVLEGVKGLPVLVVSDTPNVFSLGSMINFLVVDERLRFEVALAPVSRNGLNLSALMLTAAYKVVKERP
jgi:hypothetical protein